jgi:hypothetical protein
MSSRLIIVDSDLGVHAVCFTFGGEHEDIRIHKEMLCTYSSIFNTMFDLPEHERIHFLQMKTNDRPLDIVTQVHNLTIIRVGGPKLAFDKLHSLVKWMYTGSLRNFEEYDGLAMDIFHAACRLGKSHFTDAVIQHFRDLHETSSGFSVKEIDNIYRYKDFANG